MKPTSRTGRTKTYKLIREWHKFRSKLEDEMVEGFKKSAIVHHIGTPEETDRYRRLYYIDICIIGICNVYYGTEKGRSTHEHMCRRITEEFKKNNIDITDQLLEYVDLIFHTTQMKMPFEYVRKVFDQGSDECINEFKTSVTNACEEYKAFMEDNLDD